MGCVLERMEESAAFLGGQVQLSRTAISNVDGDDAVDLLAVGLNGDFGV
jgi:hypothetical protein